MANSPDQRNMGIGDPLSNMQTTIQNLVAAVNALGQRLVRGQGNVTSQTVSSGATLIVTGQGYLVSFAVVVAGSTAGTISNAQATALVAASNALVSCPNTVGVFQCGQAFSYGLVITPGTGQSINVTYFQ